MISPTESTPRIIGGIHQSITAAAIFLTTSFSPGVPLNAGLLAQSGNASTPTLAFTRTVQESRQNGSLAGKAGRFIAVLRRLITQNELTWHAPTISSNEDEDSIEISWWRADKSLLITVESDSPITYLKVWGPNIHSEMEEGQDTSADHLIQLWQWLYA